jgi:hypothetical protein
MKLWNMEPHGTTWNQMEADGTIYTYIDIKLMNFNKYIEKSTNNYLLYVFTS